jgi:hypothetical protein
MLVDYRSGFGRWDDGWMGKSCFKGLLSTVLKKLAFLQLKQGKLEPS